MTTPNTTTRNTTASDITASDTTVADAGRRDFLALGWRVVAGLTLAQGAYLGWRYFESRDAGGIFGEEVDAGRIREFPRGSVTLFALARFYLLRLDDGGLLALYTRCTHLSCIVNWDEGQFVCPCHGSEFDAVGDVLNEPAPRPLDRFPIVVQNNGRVTVDTGTRIERKSISPDDITYPPEGTLGA